MRSTHKVLGLATLLAFSSLMLPANAGPLPPGTLLTIEPGISGATPACATGSCFTFSISGTSVIAYYNMSPGTDGGIVVGKNQAAGVAPEPGELAGFVNATDATEAGSIYTTPYAFDPSTDASFNIFDDRSCLSSTECVGKTMLGTWNVDGSPGRGAAMGSAAKTCNIFPGLYCPGVTKWAITAAGAPGVDGDRYVLEYERIFADYLDGRYDHKFKFHLEGTIHLPKVAGVDTVVNLAAAPDPATQNTPLVYTAQVYNIGSQTATGIILTDSLPVEATFVSVVSSQGFCSGSAVVSCALGDIAGGASATVEITVLPTSTGTLSNSVSVTSAEADANPADNSATSSIIVNPQPAMADLAVSMTGTPNPVKRYKNLTYNVNVQNHGPDASKSVFAYSILPVGMSLVSVSSSQGTCDSSLYFSVGISTIVYCSLGDMANQGTATVTVVVQPRVRGTFTNTVNVQSNTLDGVSANNQASVTIRVN